MAAAPHGCGVTSQRTNTAGGSAEAPTRTYRSPAVRVRAVVPGDPAAVFAFIADTRNDPKWCPNVDSAEQIEGDGVHAGARFRYVQHLGKRPGSFEGVAEVMEIEPARIAWRVEDKFQVRDIELSARPHRRGTLLEQTTRAAFKRPPGPLRWLYPLMARRVLKEQFGGVAPAMAAAPAAKGRRTG